ncbi:hypothetical protein TWF718_007855 [Orbilia javanica]|uniref:LysM domain-containing protein n=1 Tax=Orbilia javanica TaxID=47235 RepID=A0AAN8N3N9_9PEZI
MRRTTFLVGVLGLLAGVSLATDVKSCPADEKEKRMNGACAKLLHDEVEGFKICTSICVRPDQNKPYTPGKLDNEYSPGGSSSFSLEAYNQMEEECGSHNAIVKVLESTCGCFADGYFFEQQPCEIELGKPDKSTGSVTSTAIPADTTKDHEPTSTSLEKPEDTEKAESTSTEDVETATSTAYGQKSTSVMSSASESEVETAEPTTSSMTKHKTTTHAEDESTMTMDTESPKSTDTARSYDGEEPISTEASMSTTKGYDHELEVPSTTASTELEEETQEATSTKKPVMTTSSIYERPKYLTEDSSSLEEETKTDMEETSMMHATTSHKHTSTSKHTPKSTTIEVGELSSTHYGQAEETPTSSTGEYSMPSHTKNAYTYEDTASETSTMMATTTRRAYYNAETTSEDNTPEYSTMPVRYNTTSSKHIKSTKSYGHETSMEETTTEAQRGYTTPPASYDGEETYSSSKIMTSYHESARRYHNFSMIPSSVTRTHMGYSTMEESTKLPMEYSTMEESTKSPMGYSTMEESTQTPMGYTTMDEATPSPMKYTTMEASTKTPMKYNTVEESSELPTSSTAADGYSAPPRGYTTAEETKSPMPYQTAVETTTANAPTSTHSATAKTSAITWTMESCPQPTEVSMSGSYVDGTSVDYGCLATVSGSTRELICFEASKTASNKGKWGQLPAKSLKAYKEGYEACGAGLPMALKMVCNCIDPDYTGPVPTDKPTNLVPETLPPVCTIKKCPNENHKFPNTCLKHAQEYPVGHQQQLCGLLCNKKEDGADLEGEDLKFYWAFYDMCGSHESLVTALTQTCGCVEGYNDKKTCVYPRTGPKGDRRPVSSEESPMEPSTIVMAPSSYGAPPAYTTPLAYVTSATEVSTTVHAPKSYTSAHPPKKTYVVEECPKDYEGQNKWPSGNCLHDVFGTEEGIQTAHIICNNQCADFQQTEWPADKTWIYEKALMNCKSPMEMNKALAKGCGCLNDGWVDKCRPKCQPPAGYSSTTVMPQTSAQPVTTAPAPPKEETLTTSWETTVYVTQPCNECQLTTITTVVPCSDSKTPMAPTTSMKMSTSTTTMEISTSTPVVSTETLMTTPVAYITVSPSPVWSTVTFTTTQCGGCPETTVVTTVPCPVTLNKVKTDPGNAQTCTTHNDIPQCTVPPGKLEGKAYNSNCNQWYLIKEGDTCQAVADQIPVDINLLKEWNGMQVTDNCTCSPGRWLCVSVLDGKDDHQSVRYAKGRPTYSDYGPEATNYDNLPKPSPRPYLTEPISAPEAYPTATPQPGPVEYQ